MQILVADSDWTSRESLASWLRGAGHTVGTAQDASKVWKALTAEFAPALVVVDSALANNSFGLAHRVRATAATRHCYLLLLCSATRPAAIAESFRLGADDCLVKPVDKAELLGRVSFGRSVVELQAVLQRVR